MEADAAQGRELRAQSFAQRCIECIHRAVPGGGGVVNDAVDLDLDRRFRMHRPAVLADERGEVGYLPRRFVARLQAAQEHLERRVCCLIRITAMLQFLQMLDEPLCVRIVAVELEPEFASLGEHVATLRQL